MAIPLSVLPDAPSFRDLFATPPILLTRDWFHEEIATPLAVFLGVGGGQLLFGATVRAAPWCEPARPGDFIEGLWERDVVELFLGEPGTPRYQEFNLSPRGAWWTVSLSEYRVRMETRPMPGVRCFSEVDAGGWRAALALPLDELSIRWELLNGGTVNVTAIQGNPQRFVTAADLGGGEPDFHRAERFLSPVLAR